MNVVLYAALIVLVLPACAGSAAEAQSQPPSATQTASDGANGLQTGTPKKEQTATSQQDSKSNAVHRAEEGPKENVVGLPLLRNIARDQRAIWTSPSRLRLRDTTWLMPLAGATAGLIATDQRVSRHLSNSPDTLKRYRRLSDAGALSLVGVAGGLYLWGKAGGDDHKREAGLLSGEALVDSLLLTSSIQYSGRRERPYQNSAQGRFFQHGTSFPSNHSAAVWSVASVIAHEYPGPLTKLFAYGLASAVSFSRVKSKQHFPSDVVVGSLIGWFVGKQVYRAHHDPMLGGGPWADFREAEVSEPRRSFGNRGSTYVPLESWVYPALERLAALRYINSDFRGMRPWTRTECARLTDESGERIRNDILSERAPAKEVAELQEALEHEFAPELNGQSGSRNRSLNVESVYARAMSMSGPVLNDSYHFGQTIANDYGRPDRRGTNIVAGGAVSVTYGPFFGYAWGEYQHAPSAPALSSAARNLIAQIDRMPVQPATPFEPMNGFRWLDTYAGVNWKDWQFSYGRQSLWWGTSESGPLLLSNNAAPMNMFRINRVVPFRLPWVFRVFGPMRIDFFLARVGGHQVAAHPLLKGLRISFKPTRKFEYGFTHTAMFCGEGRPCRADVFLKALVPFQELGKGHFPTENLSDLHMSFDFQYRFSRQVTWYGEFLASDDPYPFKRPRRTAVNTGLYFPRLPWTNKLDLRLEGFYTDGPKETGTSPNYLLHYFHVIYKSGHTNDGFILGNAVGRDGTGVQAWMNCWLSAKRRLVFSFKRTSVSSLFIPGGPQWNDYSVRYEGDMGGAWSIRSGVQVEQMNYLFLYPMPRRNVSVSMEVRYSPEGGWGWNPGNKRN